MFFKNLLGKKIDGSHDKIAGSNYNLKQKYDVYYNCECSKTMKIQKNSIKNIVSHIKQCQSCVVNCDFSQFIYERAGNSEIGNLRNRRSRDESEKEAIEASDRVLRSQTH